MSRQCSCGATLEWSSGDECWVDVYSGAPHRCANYKGRSKKESAKESRARRERMRKPDHCKKCGGKLYTKVIKAMGVLMTATFCLQHGEMPWTRKELEEDKWYENQLHVRDCPNCGARFSSKFSTCPGCMKIMNDELDKRIKTSSE